MRASRETDLMDAVGLRRACAWIGNSPEIAIKHYALMRKSDYIDAGECKEIASTKSDAESDAARARIGETSGEPPAGNPRKPLVSVD